MFRYYRSNLVSGNTTSCGYCKKRKATVSDDLEILRLRIQKESVKEITNTLDLARSTVYRSIERNKAVVYGRDFIYNTDNIKAIDICSHALTRMLDSKNLVVTDVSIQDRDLGFNFHTKSKIALDMEPLEAVKYLLHKLELSKHNMK